MCLPTTAVLIDELDAGSFQRLPSGNAALRMRFGTRAIRITAVGETYSIVSRVSDMDMGWSKLSPVLAGTGAFIGRRC